MPRFSTTTTLPISSSSAAAVPSPDVTTSPVLNRPPVSVTTTNHSTLHIKSPTQKLLESAEPDQVHVTAALCETRYKETREEYEDRQQKVLFERGSSNFDQDLLMEDIIAREDEFSVKDKKWLESKANLVVEIDTFQAAGIDIRNPATEENPHAVKGGRTISEEPQDPVTLSGVESDSIEIIRVIQRRYRKRRKDHQQADVSEALLEAAKLFKTITSINVKRNQAHI